jgi:hypothetical protein
MNHTLLGLGVIVVAFAAVGAAAWHIAGTILRHTGQRAAPRHDHSILPVTPADVAGQILFLGGDHTKPGVVLPRTPRAAARVVPDQLPPLPAHKPPAPVCAGPPRPTSATGVQLHGDARSDNRADAVNQAGAGPDFASGNGHHESLAERYERLFPDRRPEWVKVIQPYPDNAMAVESMFTRAQAATVRAMTGGEATGA